MKLLLKISYIGTEYAGFQCQKDARAIQNVLTEAARAVFGFPCNVTGCSRTDAGVHAYGFCATVAPREKREEPWCTIPTGKVHKAFAPHLPSDIAVVAAAQVDDGFHPRYDSGGKEYVYKIYCKPADDPFAAGRAYRFRRPITDEGLMQMQKAAESMVGTNDYSAFMASGSKIEDAVRTVYYASVEKSDDGMIYFTVAANGFLYNMVRIMAGTLLDCAVGKLDCQDIPAIIASKDRNKAGFTAPPEGLYLNRVFYENEIDWKCN